jgi:hypothetical protein
MVCRSLWRADRRDDVVLTYRGKHPERGLAGVLKQDLRNYARRRSVTSVLRPDVGPFVATTPVTDRLGASSA